MIYPLVAFLVILFSLANADNSVATFLATSKTQFSWPDAEEIERTKAAICGNGGSGSCEFLGSYTPPADILPFFSNDLVSGIRWGEGQDPTRVSGLLFSGLTNVTAGNQEYFPIGILVHENWVIRTVTALDKADATIQFNFDGVDSGYVDIPFNIEETPNGVPVGDCAYCSRTADPANCVPCPDRIFVGLTDNTLTVPFERYTVVITLRFFESFPPVGSGTVDFVTTEQGNNPFYLFGQITEIIYHPEASNDNYTIPCNGETQQFFILENDDNNGLAWDFSTLTFVTNPTEGTATVGYNSTHAWFNYNGYTTNCAALPVDQWTYRINTTDGQTVTAIVTVNTYEPVNPTPPPQCFDVSTGSVKGCSVLLEGFRALKTSDYSVNCTMTFKVPAGTTVHFSLVDEITLGNSVSALTGTQYTGSSCCDETKTVSLTNVNSNYARFALYSSSTGTQEFARLLESVCFDCTAAVCVNCLLL